MLSMSGGVSAVMQSPPWRAARRSRGRFVARHLFFFRLGANVPIGLEPLAPLPGVRPAGPPCRGVTVNLSGGGLLLESPELYPEGSMLRISLELPDSAPPAEARVEVIRDAGRASPGVRATWFLATEFLDLPDEARDRITRYIYLLQRAIREKPEPGDTSP